MSATSLTGTIDPGSTRRRHLFARFWRRPAGSIPLVIFVIIMLVAVFAPVIAPYDPNFVELAITKAPPSAAHWLGGDSSGRDILSRLIFGTRTTLWGGLVTIVTAIILGTPTGIAAGYFGRTFDRIATWISDALQSIPGMIILLVVAAGSGSNFIVLMITVGVFLSPGYYRISRSTALTVRNEPYIDAARVSGLSNLRIIALHVIRPVYPPIIIQTALTAGIALGMQSGLQFLGVGTASTPSWGQMMNDGFAQMLTAPLILLWPSAALGITIAVLALMGSTLAELVQVRTPENQRRRNSSGSKTNSPPITGALDVTATGTLKHLAETSAVRVDNLRVSYATAKGVTQVVHGISLDVAPGEVVGIVGESGSGKSQTVFSILDLLPSGGAVEADAIWISGKDVTRIDVKKRGHLLGRTIGYIPQEPMSNLDPSYTIKQQLVEPLRHVHGLSRQAALERAHEVLVRVGISDPHRVLRSHPHELSGGMAQRVLIAGAISGRPSLLVADEPTTALDVTVQAEVLELLRELQQEYDMALLIVTHNFGVVADICDRVIVMRNGSIVETGEVEQLFEHPTEDYTRELISASLDNVEAREELDTEWNKSHPLPQATQSSETTRSGAKGKL